jgi:AraC family transcriptional regulator of adaptative response/methylated-DNA-[protein]-cysteine methyltransferase
MKSNRPQNNIVLAQLKTPFGVMLAGASTKGICLLEFTDTNRVEMQIPRLVKTYSSSVSNGSSPFIDALKQQLLDYFAGKRSNFDLPLDVRGTEFQLQVWQALQAIPYGETRSYQQQAIAINKPRAVRAVANANRNNKIGIIIPCHRVIGKNGKMTGYGGGIWRKEYLLNLEKMNLDKVPDFSLPCSADRTLP